MVTEHLRRHQIAGMRGRALSTAAPMALRPAASKCITPHDPARRERVVCSGRARGTVGRQRGANTPVIALREVSLLYLAARTCTVNSPPICPGTLTKILSQIVATNLAELRAEGDVDGAVLVSHLNA